MGKIIGCYYISLNYIVLIAIRIKICFVQKSKKEEKKMRRIKIEKHKITPGK